MHAETRRDALTRIAQVGLGLTGLASLAAPRDEARTHWQTPMPGRIPPGWWVYRDNLIANVKPGPLLRSKPTQSSVYLGNGAAITAAHAGAPHNVRDERLVS